LPFREAIAQFGATRQKLLAKLIFSSNRNILEADSKATCPYSMRVPLSSSQAAHSGLDATAPTHH